MLLIVDSGSTKTDWRVLKDDKIILDYQTEGINPYLQDMTQITGIIEDGEIEEIRDKVVEIAFYGAGCAREDKKQQVKTALQDVFTIAHISVYSDMFGAARGLAGFNSGIVCVLGTGSNACEYDGSEIVENSISLGYLLGDEGSGVFLGRQLLQQYLYGRLPESLKIRFEAKYTGISKEVILDKLYTQYMPNRYMASFSEFVKENEEHPFVYGMLYESFYKFLQYHVLPFKNSSNLKINFVGSIAFNYMAILEKVTLESGLSFGKVKKSPLEGLTAFHMYNK